MFTPNNELKACIRRFPWSIAPLSARTLSFEAETEEALVEIYLCSLLDLGVSQKPQQNAENATYMIIMH